jgi:hypothetical protein
MSEALDFIVSNASEGDPLTCTLSPESVQVIFFCLGYMEKLERWQADFTDIITDEEWATIQEAMDEVTNEILP